MSLHCPSDVPRLSLIQPQAKLTHRQQSVTTPGSRTAPPSSCLQLIKPRRLNTATHHLYQLQIQPHLQLIKSQQLLAPQEKCTDNPSTVTALPSFGRMGNFPPAAHTGPAHRLDEIQTRGQHTKVKLSENSDCESSSDSTVIVKLITSRWSVDNSASPHPLDASSPRTHNSPTSLTGGDHHSLKSAQFSFAFVPSAAGMDPSTSNPAPGHPTHPHHPVTPPVLTAEQAFPHLP